MTGGAVKLACEAVREELERRGGSLDEPIDITAEHHHRPTFPLDEKGQGDAHVTFAFAAHRAVVDVDTELGLVRVVEIATAQDVGRAIHPSYVEGQMQGGVVQGIGWALNEEYVYTPEGRMANASFLDYRMPTALDLPMIDTVIVEVPNPGHPFGVRGVGEVPIVPPVAAIANAIHRAVGVRMTRAPMTPGRILEALWEREGRAPA